MASVKTEVPPFLAITRSFDTYNRNARIKRYERKCKRLVEHADFNTIAKVYEKHPKLKKAKYMKTDKKKYLKYLKKEYFLLKKALPKFAVTKDEFIQYQHFLMNPKYYCPDGIIQNNRKMYEIEKKWDQLAEHYNSYIYTPPKVIVYS